MAFRGFFALVGAVCVIAWSGVAMAEADPSHSGDLLSLRGIGGFSGVGDTDVINGGTTVERNVDDLVGGFSLALGYDFSKKGLPFRGEIEYAYRVRFDYDIRIFGGTNADFENNLSTQSVLASLYYDFWQSGNYAPFVGFGLGWARNTSDVEQTKLVGGIKEKSEESTDNFAWVLHAGVNYSLGRDWRLELAYRYSYLGDVSSGTFSDGSRVSTDTYTSHDVVIGITYAF